MSKATRRRVTETHAWCNKGQHMVEHLGFAKNQATCRECRKVYNRNNYKAAKTCPDCGVGINDKAKRCLKCSHRARRGKYLRAGGRTKTYYGYVLLSNMWDHPNTNNRGQVLEHVKVMSEMLGRPIRRGEEVHHKNGIRDDNRPENLELWTSSQPYGQRVTDLVSWAREILEQYGDEVDGGLTH